MSGGFRSRAAGRREQPKQQTQRQAKQEQGKQRYSVKSRPASIGDAPREAAFEVILRVTRDGAFANLTLPGLLKERKIKGRDAAFATELTYGTLRTMGVLDAVIAENASRPLEQIAPEVLAAVRLGAYQLLYTRVEDHACLLYTSPSPRDS